MVAIGTLDDKTLLQFLNVHNVKFGSNLYSEEHFGNAHLVVDFFCRNLAQFS